LNGTKTSREFYGFFCAIKLPGFDYSSPLGLSWWKEIGTEEGLHESKVILSALLFDAFTRFALGFRL
jgi:hypothetical protein